MPWKRLAARVARLAELIAPASSRKPVDQRASPTMSWTRRAQFTTLSISDSNFDRITSTPTCAVILGQTGSTGQPQSSGFMADDSSRRLPP